MKKKLIFALIFLIIAIGSVSASDVSLNDNQDLAINDMDSLTDDATLSMDDDSDDDDWEDDDTDDEDEDEDEDDDEDLDDDEDEDDDDDDEDLDDDEDEDDDDDDDDEDLDDDEDDDDDDDEDLDDDEDDDEEPEFNAKLEIVKKDNDAKTVIFKLTDLNNNPLPNIDLGVSTSYDWEVTKITTNSKGLAVFKLPFKSGSEEIEAGFYEVDEDNEAWYSTTTDKYCINDIFEGIIKLYKSESILSVSKAGNTYKNTVLTFKLMDKNKKALSNENIYIRFSNGKTAKITTNSKGQATYSIPFKPGTYSLTAELVSDGYKAKATLKNIKITKASATLTSTKLKTTYSSGKAFTVKVTEKNSKKAMSGIKLILKVYNGKKSKTVTVTTNSKGIARYDTSKLSIGSYKIVAKVKDAKFIIAKAKTSSIKISKATLKLTAPKVTNTVKSGTFKVKVQNKETKKAMKGVKVSVKIFTGKKYKNYSAKTKANGEVAISTKSLSKATHKVVVNVKKTSNLKAASTKSSIVITN